MLLADRGVTVHAVLTGPADTDTNGDYDVPKASLESVAGAIVDGVEYEEEDIVPHSMSQTIAAAWPRSPAKVLHRAFAPAAELAKR
jgi:short-subunit dehydrogenase